MRFQPFQQAIAENKSLIADQNERKGFVFLQYSQAVAGQIQNAFQITHGEDRQELLYSYTVHALLLSFPWIVRSGYPFFRISLR